MEENAPARSAYGWKKQINAALKREKAWRKSARDTEKRYRGDGATSERDANIAYNILYSNTETLRPALYARTPIPDIRSRWPDLNQPVVKAAARILERATSYSLDAYDFDGAMFGAITDYVLAGRGTIRVKYEPEPQKMCWAFVPWEDFCHSKARHWEEVTWVAFRHRPLVKDAQEAFPEAKGIKPDSIPEEEKVSGDEQEPEQRVTIWEIWDQPTRTTTFVAIDGGNEVVLEENADDPLSLDGFFPCPRPLMSIRSANTLLPKPEYMLYKRHADELEMVTERTEALADAIKARGGYAGKMSADFGNILQSEENTLIPLENVEALVMQGGDLSKLVWMWPIETLAAVLQIMTGRQAQIIQTIYEITGISDILRGVSDPNETASAQQIKASYGGQRIGDRQKEVQRLCRDAVRLGAEVVGKLFEPDTLMKMTGMMMPPQEMAAVMQLLRDDLAMSCVIDIETDSTIAPDVMFEQERAAQFAQGMGSFMSAIMPLVQTGALPREVAVEVVKGFTQKFDMGRAVEDALDKMGQQPPPQGPSKEQIEAEAKKQELALKDKEITGKLGIEGQKVQIEQQRLMLDAQTAAKAQQREDARFNIDAEGINHQRMMDGERLNFERENSEKSRELEGQKFAHAKRTHELGRRDTLGSNPDFAPDMLEEDMKHMEAVMQANQEAMAAQMQQFMQAMGAILQQIAQGQQQLAQAVMMPKEIIYDKGRPVGSRPMTGTMQ